MFPALLVTCFRNLEWLCFFSPGEQSPAGNCSIPVLSCLLCIPQPGLWALPGDSPFLCSVPDSLGAPWHTILVFSTYVMRDSSTIINKAIATLSCGLTLRTCLSYFVLSMTIPGGDGRRVDWRSGVSEPSQSILEPPQITPLLTSFLVSIDFCLLRNLVAHLVFSRIACL